VVWQLVSQSVSSVMPVSEALLNNHGECRQRRAPPGDSLHSFRLYVGMILILIFAEVLGLYGLIVALIMTTKNQPGCD
jgi:hypothetical protein